MPRATACLRPFGDAVEKIVAAFVVVLPPLPQPHSSPNCTSHPNETLQEPPPIISPLRPHLDHVCPSGCPHLDHVVVQTLRVAFNEHVPPPKQQTTPPFSKPKFFAARNRVGPVTFSLLLAANLPKNLLC